MMVKKDNVPRPYVTDRSISRTHYPYSICRDSQLHTPRSCQPSWLVGQNSSRADAYSGVKRSTLRYDPHNILGIASLNLILATSRDRKHSHRPYFFVLVLKSLCLPAPFKPISTNVNGSSIHHTNAPSRTSGLKTKNMYLLNGLLDSAPCAYWVYCCSAASAFL
jgi:hypothetical protein